jgi:hypothetical protein
MEKEKFPYLVPLCLKHVIPKKYSLPCQEMHSTYSELPIIHVNEGEKMYEQSKNMDNPKYFVWCIHRTSQIDLLFYTADIYFEKEFVMIACFCELFRLLLMAVRISLSSS